MDEYAEFVAANLRRGNIEQMRRQKEIEEQIEKPFCIPSDSLSEQNGVLVHAGKAVGDLCKVVDADHSVLNQRKTKMGTDRL